MKVAVIVLRDPHESARPRRLIQHLNHRGDDVVTMGWGNADYSLEGAYIADRFFRNSFLFLTGQYERLMQEFVDDGAATWLHEQEPDVVVLHDIKLLPWLVKLNGSWKIIVDLQEYYPHMLKGMRYKLSMGNASRYILRKYAGHVDAWWTVSKTLQRLYSERHAIDARLIPNAPWHHDLEPSMNHGPLRLVHHGYALADRNMEAMIEAIEELDGQATLDIVLLLEGAWPEYYGQLCGRIDRCKHVRRLEPVPIDEIVTSKNQYDAGLYVLPPDSENMAGAMPNKFYDFVQARLAVICGPDGEMAGVVDAEGLGALTDGYAAADIAATLRALPRNRIDPLKQRVHQRARSHSYDAYVHVIDEDLKRLGGAQ